MGQPTPAAWLQVTHGSPTAEELAVLTAVLLARTGAATTAAATTQASGTTWYPDLFEAPHSWHHHA
jgi:hypothetical protein